MHLYCKTDFAQVVAIVRKADRVFLLSKNGLPFSEVTVKPLTSIVDLIREHIEQTYDMTDVSVVPDFLEIYQRADGASVSLYLAMVDANEIPEDLCKTFPQVLGGAAGESWRLPLFKAFQYMMGVHLQNLKVLEDKELR